MEPAHAFAHDLDLREFIGHELQRHYELISARFDEVISRQIDWQKEFHLLTEKAPDTTELSGLNKRPSESNLVDVFRPPPRYPPSKQDDAVVELEMDADPGHLEVDADPNHLEVEADLDTQRQDGEPSSSPVIEESRDWEISSNFVKKDSSLFKRGVSLDTIHISLKEEGNEQLEKTLKVTETFSATLVFLDIVFIGWQVQARATEGALWNVARVGDTIICMGFMSELFIRAALLRSSFFSTENRVRNVFDIVIVVSTALEVASNWVDDAVSELRMLRMLRQLRPMLRLLRLSRIIRTLRFLVAKDFCRELRMIISSLSRVARSLIWVLMVMATLTYMCSITLVSATLAECSKDNRGDADVQNFCMYFNTLSQSTWSLAQAALGGLLWSDLAKTLYPLNPIYLIVFVAYVSSTQWVIMGLVYGIINTIMQQNAVRDLADIIYDEIEDRKTSIQYLHEIFKLMDLSKTGSVSSAEFELAMENDRVAAFFRAFKITGYLTHRQLFTILDSSCHGAVDEHAFIERLMALKGAARNVDLLALCDPRYRDNMGKRTAEVSIASRQTVPHPDALMGDLVEIFKSDGKPIRRIKKVEERAISLDELLDVYDMVSHRSKGHHWTDLSTNSALTPELVNLYHFSYYVISPFTAPENVMLEGLDHNRAFVGCTLAQPHSSKAVPRAVGEVVNINAKGNVEVKLLRGRFVAGAPVLISNPMVSRISENDAAAPMTPRLKCSERSISDAWSEASDVGTLEKVQTPGACSYKELVATGPLKPRWFISHWWGEPVLTFIRCVQRHAQLRHLRGNDGSYWACAYANCQHQLDDELGQDPDNSSFAKAMRLAEGTLLVLDSNATPFDRIWCDFELFKTVTLQRPLDIVTECHGEPLLLADQVEALPNESMLSKSLREQSFPIKLIHKGLQTKLEEGDASMESDKRSILDSMTKSGYSVDMANSRLHGFLARAVWPQATRHNKVEMFQLPQILSRDTNRKKLQISLAHFDEVGDADICSIAKGIPPQIECVRLSFQGCQRLTNDGLGVLARRIGFLTNLTELMLDFVGCTMLSDAGLEMLAMSLPANLQKLELHFDMCTHISNNSVASLADQFGPSLKRFLGTFKRTRVDKDFKTKAELLAYCSYKGLSKGHAGKREIMTALRQSTVAHLSSLSSDCEL